MNRKPESKRQERDKRVSLEAMERFIEMKLPSIIKNIDYEVIKPKVKSTFISDVEIIVAPDLIIKGHLNGKTVIGAVKIHISKENTFDLQQSKIVAYTIAKYLDKEIAKDGIIVLPELCFCIDVFGDRIISAKECDTQVDKKILEICREIKRLWTTI